MTRSASVPSRDSSFLRSLGIRPRTLVLPVLAGTLTLLSALTLTVVSAWLITRSWQMPPIMDITVAVTAVRALGISRAAFRYLDRLITHDVALESSGRTRTALWRRLANAPASLWSGWQRGSVLTRLGGDIDAVTDLVVRAVVPGAVAFLTSVIAIVFVALLSPAAALTLAVGLIVAGVGTPYLHYKATVRAQNAQYEASRAHNHAVDHVLSHSAALRIHGTLEDELERAHAATHAVARAQRLPAPATARSSGVAEASVVFTAIATVLIALWTYTDAAGTPLHTQEWLTVLILVPLAAFESVGALPAAAESLAQARAALARLRAVEESRSTHSDYPPLRQPSLQAHELVTGYTSDLQRWDLDLPFGTRKEIIAPSGAGKTTLLRTLAGLVPARSGSVLISDANSPYSHILLEGNAVEPPSGIVRFVAEDEHVFSTTIRDNIAVGNPQATDALIRDVTDALGLGEWVRGLDDGLDTVLADGDASLSGGQRRRLILARALVSTAPILLLDEPVEHVDTSTQKILDLLLDPQQLVGELPQRTILIVHHPRS